MANVTIDTNVDNKLNMVVARALSSPDCTLFVLKRTILLNNNTNVQQMELAMMLAQVMGLTGRFKRIGVFTNGGFSWAQQDKPVEEVYFDVPPKGFLPTAAL